MCGFIGSVWKNGVSPDGAEEELRSIDYLIEHRGPNESRAYVGQGFSVLHRRLSIVDIENGHQPMIRSKGRLGLAYNGEIYNYKELKNDLEKHGAVFETDCDTEVLLRLFETFGVHAFEMLDGMFSAFIWDFRENERGEFFLLRDHLGVKPLYVYEDEERYVFSSELVPLLAMRDIDQSLNASALSSFLNYRYCQGAETFFKRIERVSAGSYLRISNAIKSQWHYWDLPCAPENTKLSFDEAALELREMLFQSVKKQQMGEVPVGILLSGGLDSSVVAAICGEMNVPLESFNIGFEDLNEFEFSREVAEKFSLPHRSILTSPAEMADSFSSVVRAMDEPISDPACLPLHLLCNSIKERVTVVLSGEGADELMGGYNQYMHTLNSLGAETNLLDAFKKFSWYFLEKPSLLKAGYQSPDSLHSFDHYFARRGTLDGMLAYDMKTWLPENLMAKADKITMSHSLEGRFPFLSKSIAEFCFSLPNEYKVENGVGKKILRRAFENDIPDNVIQRPKMGFSVPIDGLLLELRERLNGNVKLLANSGLADVLEMEVVEAEIEKYYAGESNDSLWIWTIAVLLEWFSQLNSGELFNSKRN